VIPVNRPIFPPLEDYVRLLEGVWERSWLTNDGPLVRELEQRLADYLGVNHVIFTSNGTVALQLAIKALGLSGEIITTPFSYVATTATIVWEGCNPVFADVLPDTLTIDPALIERAISPRTSAILATHVYGIPCDVEAIAEIARRRSLRVIYDAAHAFGVRYMGRSLPSYGDVATLSFHATKIFHSGEGGALVTNDAELAHTLRYMRSFGHDGPERFFGLGINAKNSELHAAMGLCLLPRVPDFISARKKVGEIYKTGLAGSPVRLPSLRADMDWNYCYYPILLPDEATLARVMEDLRISGIGTRRYFYPALTGLPYISGASAPIAEDAASRVLCLPMYSSLTESEAEEVVDKVASSLSVLNP
jgi:dTDP-4-amino-4,6-dideoxygalactose transaminase